MSLTANLGELTANLSAIRDQLIAQGADIPHGLPLIDWPEAIAAIEAGEPPSPPPTQWQRPADRPTKPAIEDNTILMLFGATAYSPNDIAFQVTSLGGYSVDWGDGEVTIHTSVTTAEHAYGFDDLDLPVDAQGYKMAWITVRPSFVDGVITVYNVSVRPSWRPTAIRYIPQVFELYVHCSALTSLLWGWAAVAHYALLEIFSLAENSITGPCDNLLHSCNNLRHFEELHLERVSTLHSFLSNCTLYDEPFPDYLDFHQPLNIFMLNCISYNQPFGDHVTFAAAGTNFMQTCTTYNQPFPPQATFSTVTSAFLNGCSSYNQPFREGVTFQSVTTHFLSLCMCYNQPFPSTANFANAFDNFLNGCAAFNFGVTVDLQGRSTNLGASFIGVQNLSQKWLRLANMGDAITGFTIANTALDVDALVTLFSDLFDRSDLTAGTLTITNVFGASRLSEEQRAIATDKNWVLNIPTRSLYA